MENLTIKQQSMLKMMGLKEDLHKIEGSYNQLVINMMNKSLNSTLGTNKSYQSEIIPRIVEEVGDDEYGDNSLEKILYFKINEINKNMCELILVSEQIDINYDACAYKINIDGLSFDNVRSSSSLKSLDNIQYDFTELKYNQLDTFVVCNDGTVLNGEVKDILIDKFKIKLLLTVFNKTNNTVEKIKIKDKLFYNEISNDTISEIIKNKLPENLILISGKSSLKVEDAWRNQQCIQLVNSTNSVIDGYIKNLINE